MSNNGNNSELRELEARLRAMQADERTKTEARFEEIERRVKQLEMETAGWERQPFTEGDDGRIAHSSK
jgi:hypothetical protein